MKITDVLLEFAPGGNSASSYYAVTANFVNDFVQQKQEEIQDLIDAGWTKQDLAQAGTQEGAAADIAHLEQVRDGFLKGLKSGFDAYLQGDTQMKDQLGASWIDNDLPLNQDWEKIYGEPWGDNDIDEGVAEGAGNIGAQIKAAYQRIYDQGDDAVEFAYNDSPIFAQYWDEYEGDLDSIIAEVDPWELQVILAELQSAAEDQEDDYYDLPMPNGDRDDVAEGSIGTYILNVMDEATGEHWAIEIQASSPDMAKEQARQQGYKVLRIKEKGVAEAVGGRNLLQDIKAVIAQFPDPDDNYDDYSDAWDNFVDYLGMEGAEDLDAIQRMPESQANAALLKHLQQLGQSADYIRNYQPSVYESGVTEGSLNEFVGNEKDFGGKPAIKAKYQHGQDFVVTVNGHQYSFTVTNMEAQGENPVLFNIANHLMMDVKDRQPPRDIQQAVANYIDEYHQRDLAKVAAFHDKKHTQNPDYYHTTYQKPLQRVSDFVKKDPDQDVAEGKREKPEQPEADYGDDYQAMVARVKKLAGLGPLKTVYDPQKRVYKNVPTAVQPKKEQ